MCKHIGLCRTHRDDPVCLKSGWPNSKVCVKKKEEAKGKEQCRPFWQPQLMNRKVKLKKFTQVTMCVGHIQQLLAENVRLLFDLASVTSVAFHCPFQNSIFVSVRICSYKIVRT